MQVQVLLNRWSIDQPGAHTVNGISVFLWDDLVTVLHQGLSGNLMSRRLKPNHFVSQARSDHAEPAE